MPLGRQSGRIRMEVKVKHKQRFTVEHGQMVVLDIIVGTTADLSEL